LIPNGRKARGYLKKSKGERTRKDRKLAPEEKKTNEGPVPSGRMEEKGRV